MSPARATCLARLGETTECNVVLVTPETLPQYILQNHPLHPGYPYLSAVHKADYLRTYFMQFYGGGYADIKLQTGSWKRSFALLNGSNGMKWICGYPEIGKDAVCGPPDLQSRWTKTIGLGAFICRPNTPLTRQWYTRLMQHMDATYAELQAHPATDPRDHSGLGTGYPLQWSELLGQIFHPIVDAYLPYVSRSLPIPLFEAYR